jgi:hypothetical protein
VPAVGEDPGVLAAMAAYCAAAAPDLAKMPS